ncbi:MAG: HemK2/MTQ2 family protein methyltransferase [Thermoplasmata archaeon]
MSHSHAPGRAESGSSRANDLVYPPREDSLLLLPFARVARGSSLLEVCAGSGVAALDAARSGARVVATDLNPWALAALRRRARDEALSVDVVRTDLAAGLGRFDRILANPPYLPTPPELRDPDPWHNLALDGGPDGCRVTARLVESLPDHLAPSGSACVVFSSLQSPEGVAAIRERWSLVGPVPEVVARRALEGERLEVWRFRRGAPNP